jgi:cytochrome c553
MKKANLFAQLFNFRSFNTVVFTVATLTMSGTLQAETDTTFEIGKKKAEVCMTCHGRDGISLQEPYPNLRGQKYAYMVSALKDYKSRQRSSGLAILMQQQADLLSELDMEDISYYYSKLGQDSTAEE